MNSATTGEGRSTYTVLVTGANSGLGFSTCCRLIDEFLFTRPQTQTLRLIATTRDQRKNADTLARLQKHLQKTVRAANGKTLGIGRLLEPRIQLEGELVDLTSLRTVQALAKRLRDQGRHIDVLVLNAGIGGWSGIDWPTAIWTVVTDWLHAVTYPTYKLGYTGAVARAQLTARKASRGSGQGQGQGQEQQQQQEQEPEPPLGEVFTANVFGHYLLSHLLAPLMRGSRTGDTEPGRIVWISSIEAYTHSLALDDLQGLRTDASYESSKRLTDLLVLTSDLPSTRPYVSAYLADENEPAAAPPPPPPPPPPKLFVAHPGVCATSIAGLNPIMHALMLCAFHIARWAGSPWHPISPYLGAVSAVWLALTPLSALVELETTGGKGKWGSSTDARGNERVIRTEVEGWGWGGKLGEEPDGAMRISRGRHRALKRVTKETREEFEDAGRLVWREMEGLREEWEERLRKGGDANGDL
ncbi:hypothetical protein MBLNU459_g2799t1 [Dothideomycetes sp. NU459]